MSVECEGRLLWTCPERMFGNVRISKVCKGLSVVILKLLCSVFDMTTESWL